MRPMTIEDFLKYVNVESEVDMEIDFVCGKVLLSEGALSEVQTAIRNACAHLLVISYRQENILADTKVSKFQP